MANWSRTLDIKDVWQRAEADEISVQELSKVIAERLSKIKYSNKIVQEELGYLIENFEILAEDEEVSEDTFDMFMNDLYNFGDMELENGYKILWIACY